MRSQDHKQLRLCRFSASHRVFETVEVLTYAMFKNLWESVSSLLGDGDGRKVSSSSTIVTHQSIRTNATFRQSSQTEIRFLFGFSDLELQPLDV